MSEDTRSSRQHSTLNATRSTRDVTFAPNSVPWWQASTASRVKKRTALLRMLKQLFRSHRSRPISEVIAQINPILRGWVQYCAVGHSSRCFSYIRDWVDKKIRHHLVRASQRHGFGWKRWSNAWLYGTLGLFAEYRVAH